MKLVWCVDPERKEVDVCPKASAKRKKTLGGDGESDGGTVLPGLTLNVSRPFASRAPAKKTRRKGKK